MLNTLHLRSALIVGASAVALSSVASPAWSQNVIQELVVTAQKREEALQDVPIAVSAFSLALGQKSLSGSPTGSRGALDSMLGFAARHGVAPQNEHFPMSRVNEALDHLRAGKARYRIVLDADFG